MEIDAKHAGGEAALDALRGQLTPGSFLLGGDYTIADIALYGYTHVADEAGFDLSGRPAIRAWLARVAAQPGHVQLAAWRPAETSRCAPACR